MIAKKNQFIKLAGAVLACAVISACSSDNSGSSLNKGKASSGDADFSKFVSIGDSLTAGFADGALYLLGQQNSFPNTLAKQFADADGVAVAFEQPLATTNFGGFLVNGTAGILENRFVLNTETQSPERLAGDPTEEVIGSGLNGMLFNNVGVPGAKSFHLLAPNFGDPAGIAGMTANPYFVRFASSTTATVVEDAAVQQAPSFFTLWIGNNDVLGFATSGGYGPDVITPPATFAGAYDGIIATLMASNANAQGVLINIPDVSTIPFFTTVPFNPIPMDQSQADDANAGVAGYNGALASAVGAALLTQEEADQRKLTFAVGQNAVVIADEDLTSLLLTIVPIPSLRQATANDLIVLPAASIIGTLQFAGVPESVIGVGVPLLDELVLIPSEIDAINVARVAYNDKIKAVADANANFVFFDAAAIMVELKESGIDFGTGSINSTFATGGAFGLDGVHPTGRGYTVIANEIIDVINTGFNANVHKVDPALFPTIFLK